MPLTFEDLKDFSRLINIPSKFFLEKDEDGRSFIDVALSAENLKETLANQALALSNIAKNHPKILFGVDNDIPDDFFVKSAEKKSSDSSNKRFNPVAAVSSPDGGWESAIAKAPSSNKKKKKLVIDASFFKVDPGKYHDKIITRRIEQVNKLKKLGFNIYYPSVDGASRSMLSIEDEFRREDIQKIQVFDQEFDYRLLEEKGIANKQAKILNEKTAQHINSLFYSRIDTLHLNNDLRDELGWDQIAIEVSLGNINAVNEYIKKGNNVDKSITRDGRTLLYFATYHGHKDIVKGLIELNANPDIVSTDLGTSPLHVAAFFGHVDIAQQLIKAGAKPNQKNNQGLNPLYLAAKNGHEDVVKLLLTKEVNSELLENVDESGDSALHLAARNGNVNIVQQLIEAGSNANRKNNLGEYTPLHIAAHHGHENVAKALLIKGGSELVKEVDEVGSSPLHVAAICGHEGVAQQLVKAGANPNQKNNYDSTPLHYAAQNGHEDVVRELIKVGAELDQKNIKGATPLHIADSYGNEGIVQQLIEAGATVSSSLQHKEGLMRIATGERIDNDELEQSKAKYNMEIVGESLNSNNSFWIRCGIYKTCHTKERVLLENKKPEESKLTAVQDFEKFVSAKIDGQEYKKRDKKNDGEFYLLNYHEEPTETLQGNYGARLLSVHCQDQLEKVLADNGAEILGIQKDEDGFYHVITNKKCNLIYILKIPPEKDLKKPDIDPKMQELINEYRGIRLAAIKKDRQKNPGDIQFPRSNYLSKEDWLDAIYQSGGGSCRDRVKAFEYMANQKGIDPETYRIVDIDSNHSSIELKDQNGTWHYHELGGRASDEKKIDDNIGSLVYHSSTTTKKHQTLDESFKRALDSSILVQDIDSISQVTSNAQGPLINTKSLLITKQTNLVANDLIKNARSQNREVFYIDNPSKIDIFNRTLSLKDPNPTIQGSGFLAQFLESVRGQDPNNPSLIIVNWNNFDATQKVALNTILDQNPTAQGQSLANCQIVGISKDNSTDESFLSRHDNVYKSTEGFEKSLIDSATSKTELTTKAEVTTIDFEGYNNWRQKLFGEVKLTENRPVWDIAKSKFIDNLGKGNVNFEFKNFSNEVKKDLEYELAQARAFGYFSYQGRRIIIPEDLKVEFAAKTFDFSKFKDQGNICIFKDQVFNKISASAKIINTQNFERLLHDKEIDNGIYTQTPGLIEQSQGSSLELFITSLLSEAQYYCLFNEAKKHNVALDLRVAPNAQIPKTITDQFSEEVFADQDEPSPSPASFREKPHAKIAVTNDANAYLDKTDTQSALIFDVEDYSYGDLVESISFESTETGFANFNKKTSYLVQALSKGQKVILKGQFSDDLLQNLQRIMVTKGIKGLAENLTLILEEKESSLQQIANQFNWLTDDVQIESYPEVKVLTPIAIVEPDPISPKPQPSISIAQKDSVQIKSEADQFISKRKSTIKDLLSRSPIIRLTGPTGVGKSSLMRDYGSDPATNCKLYTELSSIKKWAKDRRKKVDQKILFIDEANIEDMHFTMFAPLLKSQRPVTILYQGEFLTLTSQHKVVFAGNDLNYGGGRNEQKLFSDYPIPSFEMKDFTAEYIYDKLLKETIFDKTDFVKAELNLNDQENSILQNKFQEECQGLILKYLNVNKRAQEEGKQHQAETVRELQEYALNYLAKEINERLQSLESKSTQSANYVSTAATKAIEGVLTGLMNIKDLQSQGILPAAAGLGGVFLEGGSGIGKSSLIEAILPEGHCKIDASTPTKEKERIITTAFEQGKPVWIDELNACIDDGLEKILNAVLTGHHPQTQKASANPGFFLVASANKASMEGRDIIGPALRARMHCPTLPTLKDFTKKDIEAIVEHWYEKGQAKSLVAQDEDAIVPAVEEDLSKEIEEITTSQIADKFYEEMQSNEKLNLRDMSRVFAKIQLDYNIKKTSDIDRNPPTSIGVRSEDESLALKSLEVNQIIEI